MSVKIKCTLVWNIIAVFIMLFIVTKGSFEGILREYCSVEVFHPTCPSGEVIKIMHAWYGRMKLGRCVKTDYGRLGCATDVLQQVDSRCSGNQSCTVDINDLHTVFNLPCIGELRAYLEARYICEPVYTPTIERCSSQYIVDADQSPRVLSSYVSAQKKCGLHNTPWLLKVKPGQQIKLTLTDFSWSNASGSTNGRCVQRYGYVLDTETDDVINICGGTARQKAIVQSHGYSLQIVLDENAVQNYKFLISFQVLGCPEYKAPPHSWLDTVNNSLIVSCQSSEESWTLKCVENNWLGIVGECPALSTTMAAIAVTDNIERQRTLPSVSRNHVIAFGLACVTLLVCCSVVVIGYYCTKRYVIDCEAKLEKHQMTSQYFPNGTVLRIKTNPRQQNRKPTDGTVSTELPPYSAPLPRDQRAPPVPHRTSSYRAGDMSESMMSDYLAPQGGDDNSVQYYILENPTESGGKEEMYQSIHLFSSLERAPEHTQ